MQNTFWKPVIIIKIHIQDILGFFFNFKFRNNTKAEKYLALYLTASLKRNNLLQFVQWSFNHCALISPSKL